MTAFDDIDWDELMAHAPGALWVLPDMDTIPTEPEIPMPAELEETAAVWDAQIESVFSLIGVPTGSSIIASACRAVWAQISAAIMAHRREYIAASGAHTELDYYGQETDTMPETTAPRPTVVAVIAQTKARAEEIALSLGIDAPWLFGNRMASTFDGLRVDRVIIDADSAIDPAFIATAHANARKTPGGTVSFVTVRDFR